MNAIDVVRIVSAMRRRRGVSRQQLAQFQQAWLRRLIAHVHDEVPHYRALFQRHGLTPERIRSTADLRLIPMTTRRDIQRASPAELLARGVDPARLIAYRTSGSSGEPLTVRRTWLEERVGSAVRLRALREVGVRAGDLRVQLWAGGGRLTPNGPMKRDAPLRLMRSLRLNRKVEVDYRIPMTELLDRLAALQPDVLTGSPSLLARTGRTMMRERPGSIAPGLVISGGEVLVPLERQQIGDSFGARVVDMYGSHELGLIAWDCPRGAGMHVADDSVILEVVKDGRPAEPGEAGEVVATRLHAFAMPFIRYRTGDLATLGPTPCPCGAPFSTLRTVQGRMIDHFVLPDGGLLHPNELVVAILRDAARWIAQFQLTQETRERVVLRVAPLVSPTPEETAALEAHARAKLGAGIEFQLLLVPEISLEINGKFRVSRSFVQSVYDEVD